MDDWDDWGMTGLGMDSRGMTGALIYTVDSSEGLARMQPLARLGLGGWVWSYKKKNTLLYLVVWIYLVNLGNKDDHRSIC